MTQKIALVTGASRGLGAAMVEQLALQGWHVVAVARTTGGLEELDDRVKAAGLPGAAGLTLAPMDRRLIDPRMLTAAELQWLNAYHARVYDTLAPRVDTLSAIWLQHATAPID